MLLAFYVYGPSTYEEMANYLGHLRSRVSIANQLNIQLDYLEAVPEMSHTKRLVKRFHVTQHGIDRLKAQGHRQVRD